MTLRDKQCSLRPEEVEANCILFLPSIVIGEECQWRLHFFCRKWCARPSWSATNKIYGVPFILVSWSLLKGYDRIEAERCAKGVDECLTPGCVTEQGSRWCSWISGRPERVRKVRKQIIPVQAAACASTACPVGVSSCCMCTCQPVTRM